MVLRKLGWLTLSLLFLTLSGSLGKVESKTADKKTASFTTKKTANIKGFRSAKFWMEKKDVLKAIAKDFKISKNKIRYTKNSMEKTSRLEIVVPKLIGLGGTARIAYILGFKSKKLMQVNILWGRGADEPSKKFDAKGVIDAANFLRNHLMKKKYEKEGYAANARMDNVTTVVFRGKDKKGRMALLVLTTPEKEKGESLEKARSKISLELSYRLNPDNPDILSVQDDDF